MKKLLGVLVLLSCTSGCFFEERGGHGHHGPKAVAPVHNHCEGCGHVQIKGVWTVGH